MAPTGTLFHFLVIVGIKGEKGSLEHVKTWFRRRFCCLVMYANSARFGKIFIFFVGNQYYLPRISIEMAFSDILRVLFGFC
jgi:hypothetical protein